MCRGNSSKATITNNVTELPASTANNEPKEILINAQPSASGKPTEVTALHLHLHPSLTPRDESPHNISTGLPSASDEDVCPVNLKLCSEVNYEKGCVHGVAYRNDWQSWLDSSCGQTATEPPASISTQTST